MPLGGSIGITREKTFDLTMDFPGQAVWAAQYQLLDTKYIMHGSANDEALRSISLLPDITSMSRGSLRRLDDESDVTVYVCPVGMWIKIVR